MVLANTSKSTNICNGCALRSRQLCRAVLGLSDHSCQQNTPRLRSVSSETVLQEENEQPQFAAVLRKGYLRTERILQDGRRSVLGFYAPGDMIGDVLGTIRGPALVSVTDAEFCSFDPAALRRAMQGDPWITTHFLGEAMKQYSRQLEMIWRRGSLNSRERIIAFLVMAAEFMPVEPQPDGSIILSVKVSRKDWADFSNTSVETICRTLSYLAEKDLVATVAPSRYRIADLTVLARLAGLDSLSDHAAMAIEEIPQIMDPAATQARIAARGNRRRPKRSNARPKVESDPDRRFPNASQNPD